MKASADDAPPGKGSGEGWDENILVWNATVAMIPAAHHDSAQKPPASEGPGPESWTDRGAEPSEPEAGSTSRRHDERTA